MTPMYTAKELAMIEKIRQEHGTLLKFAKLVADKKANLSQ